MFISAVMEVKADKFRLIPLLKNIIPGGGGGTCQNFDRDARPIFFGFEIWPNPIFLGWQMF